MSNWKEIKQIHRIKGCDVKYLISDKGEVKLEAYYKHICYDSELLSIGHGIYVGNDNELGVYYIGGSLYRYVYKLFIGDIPKYYQIHHKDYNHYNNSVDNLECLSAYQHGLKHINTSKFMYDKDCDKHKEEYELWLKSTNQMNIIKNTKYTIYDSRKCIIEIYQRFEDNLPVAIEQYKRNKQEIFERNKERRKQQKEKERQAKVDSGEYYIDESGHLIKTHRPKWTSERRETTMATRKHVYESADWRYRIGEGVKKYHKNKHN